MGRPEQREAILLAIEKQTLVSGRFTSLKRVGTKGGDGTFSLVVSAQDQQTGKLVALKFFNPQFRKDVYRWASFQREAELLSRFVGQKDILQFVAPIDSFLLTFDHEGIELDLDFSYYGVELALGSAIEAVANDEWSLLQKLESFQAMCRGVQRSHSAGIVHRDIKLSNFLVQKDSIVKLCDFGTAKSLTDGSDPVSLCYTAPVGDLTYAPLESYAALHDVSPEIYLAADIYSLGVVLFEMLTGTPLNPHLFTGSVLMDLMEAMNAVPRGSRTRVFNEVIPSVAAGHPLPALRAFAVDLPPGVGEILDRLYKDMCALDYRARLTDFRSIFSRISRAVIILRNEEAYRAWRAQREVYRRNAEAKRLRRSLALSNAGRAIPATQSRAHSTQCSDLGLPILISKYAINL